MEDAIEVLLEHIGIERLASSGAYVGDADVIRDHTYRLAFAGHAQQFGKVAPGLVRTPGGGRRPGRTRTTKGPFEIRLRVEFTCQFRYRGRPPVDAPDRFRA